MTESLPLDCPVVLNADKNLFEQPLMVEIRHVSLFKSNFCHEFSKGKMF